MSRLKRILLAPVEAVAALATTILAALLWKRDGEE